MPKKDVLAIDNYELVFRTPEGDVKALNGVNLRVPSEEILGLIGETGCGKSVTAISIMRLLSPSAKVIKGSIVFEGQDLLIKKESEMRTIRGCRIAMIFQDPSTSLNPLMKVGDQVAEAIVLHQQKDKSEARKQTIELLKSINVASPESIIDAYPHQLSGGMKQRIMIATAISCNPTLLIADEPTSSLDLTTQGQILELFMDIRKRRSTSMLFVTHNLGVVAELCDKVGIMYCGRVVEYGSVRSIFENAQHPYTRGLFDSVRSLYERTQLLKTIPGIVPNLINVPPGCMFHPRCKYSMDICQKERPEYVEAEHGHIVACHKEM